MKLWTLAIASGDCFLLKMFLYQRIQCFCILILIYFACSKNKVYAFLFKTNLKLYHQKFTIPQLVAKKLICEHFNLLSGKIHQRTDFASRWSQRLTAVCNFFILKCIRYFYVNFTLSTACIKTRVCTVPLHPCFGRWISQGWAQRIIVFKSFQIWNNIHGEI